MDKLEDQPDQSGGCLCGKVRYELKGPYYYGVLCHCVTCRRVTGGSFLAASIYPINVRLSGPPFHPGLRLVARLVIASVIVYRIIRYADLSMTGFQGHKG